MKAILDEIDNVGKLSAEVQQRTDEHHSALQGLAEPRRVVLDYYNTQKACAKHAVQMVKEALNNIQIKIYRDIGALQLEQELMERMYLDTYTMYYICQYHESVRAMRRAKKHEGEEAKAKANYEEWKLLGGAEAAIAKRDMKRHKEGKEKALAKEEEYLLQLAKLDTDQWEEGMAERFEKWAAEVNPQTLKKGETIADLRRWSKQTKNLLMRSVQVLPQRSVVFDISGSEKPDISFDRQLDEPVRAAVFSDEKDGRKMRREVAVFEVTEDGTHFVIRPPHPLNQARDVAKGIAVTQHLIDMKRYYMERMKVQETLMIRDRVRYHGSVEEVRQMVQSGIYRAVAKLERIDGEASPYDAAKMQMEYAQRVAIEAGGSREENDEQGES